MKYYKYIFKPINIFLNSDMVTFELLSKVFNIMEYDISNYKQYNEKYTIVIKNNSTSYEIELYYNDSLVMVESINKQMLIIFISEVVESLIASDRNLISFHSSGFLFNETLILFANKSGSGKSTALISCLREIDQSKYFADDRVVVDNKYNLYGVSDALKLKLGTIEMLGIHDDDLLGPYEKLNLKLEYIDYWFYLPKNPSIKTPISYQNYKIVIIIIKYKANHAINTVELKGIEKINALVNNCYDINKNTGTALTTIKKLAEKANVYQVNYSTPSDLVTLLMTL